MKSQGRLCVVKRAFANLFIVSTLRCNDVLRQHGLLWQLLSVILQTDFEQRSTKTPGPMKAPSLEKLD